MTMITLIYQMIYSIHITNVFEEKRPKTAHFPQNPKPQPTPKTIASPLPLYLQHFIPKNRQISHIINQKNQAIKSIKVNNACQSLDFIYNKNS